MIAVKNGVTILAWPNGILFFLGLMALFSVLNFFGIRLLSEANRWATWRKIIIPSLTAIFVFTVMDTSSFSSLTSGPTRGFTPFGTAPIFEALSTTGIIFSCLGFRQALDYAGEAENPQRHVPLATILSVIIGMVIYVALQIAFIGVVSWHAAGVRIGNWAGLAASRAGGQPPWASSPLVSALKAAGVGWLATYAWVLLADAGISPSATGWVYMGTSGRTNYSLSVNRMLPKSFQTPNRWGIPWLSMVVAAVIGCVFVVPAPSWYMPRPFRLPQMWLWAPAGFLAAWMIVYWSTFSELVQIYGAVFLGHPVHGRLAAAGEPGAS